MDDPQLPRDEHLQALTGLSRLNRVSGVASLMYRQLRLFANAVGDRPLNVLDIASGSGDVPLAWVRWSQRAGRPIQLTMLDISSTAANEQQRRAKQLGVDALSVQQDCLMTGLPGGFDVVTCSLFMHHLDDHHVFTLLQAMQMASHHGIVVCDLERSRLNLTLVATAARLLSRSPIVHHDASASVRGAYTAREFESLAETALARPVRVRRLFPCRFIATVAEDVVEESMPALAWQGTS